jgi:hypothetical protein
LHVVPLPSFADGRMLDIVSVLANGTHLPLPPDEVGFPNQDSVNLDGYLNYAVAPKGARLAYAQFFRNGAIEGVGELRSDDGVNSRFIGSDFTKLVVSRVRQYLDVLKSYEMGLPVYVFLSLCSAERVVYRHAPDGMGWIDTRPIGRAIVALPEIQVDSFDVDVPAVLRPLFNVLWNAVGFGLCDMYDGKGKFRGIA